MCERVSAKNTERARMSVERGAVVVTERVACYPAAIISYLNGFLENQLQFAFSSRVVNCSWRSGPGLTAWCASLLLYLCIWEGCSECSVAVRLQCRVVAVSVRVAPVGPGQQRACKAHAEEAVRACPAQGGRRPRQLSSPTWGVPSRRRSALRRHAADK